MAHKKGQGTSKNGRDSNSKRLGVKKFGSEHVIPGNIILRQRGTKFHQVRTLDWGKTIRSMPSPKARFSFTATGIGKWYPWLRINSDCKHFNNLACR